MPVTYLQKRVTVVSFTVRFPERTLTLKTQKTCSSNIFPITRLLVKKNNIYALGSPLIILGTNRYY